MTSTFVSILKYSVIHCSSLASVSICCCVTKACFWLKWSPQQSNTWENSSRRQVEGSHKDKCPGDDDPTAHAYQCHLNWNRHAQLETGFKTLFLYFRGYHAEVGVLAGVSLCENRAAVEFAGLEATSCCLSSRNCKVRLFITCHQERWAIMWLPKLDFGVVVSESNPQHICLVLTDCMTTFFKTLARKQCMHFFRSCYFIFFP